MCAQGMSLSLVTWLLLGSLGLARAASTGTVTGTVQLIKSGSAIDPSGVVVFLEGVQGALPVAGAAPPEHAKLIQRELQFSPPLLVVVQGTTVDFVNDDKVFHNVFSLSEAARFDLGLYKSGTSKSVTFRKPGVINVYCNIHPDMVSKIKVLDTTYFSVVGKDGAFRIGHVPPGTYPIVAWQPTGAEFRGEIKVSEGGKSELNIELQKGAAEIRHTRKDGTPYGRYK